MAPTRDRTVDSEAVKKRKRDRAETEEERRNRKKQKSKRKSLPQQNGQQDGDDLQTHPGAQSEQTNGLSDAKDLQLVRQDHTNRQVESVSPATPWKVSKPIGGRMLDIDPVFSVDEV
jgi:NET1-associated nuclear protein 1 (U3 small nucleolar RNA-associated protein 17)